MKCSQNREHRPERFGVNEIVAICGSGDNWYDHIPKAFSRHWPQRRPTACTISTVLRFGSANSTQSIFGTSIPSVRQRAFVIKAAAKGELGDVIRAARMA